MASYAPYHRSYGTEERGFERLPSGIYVARAQLEEEEQGGLRPSEASRDADDAGLPLEEVSVEVKVLCTVARTSLVQKFVNPSRKCIERAKYCFPLYDGAAVVSFRFFLGEDRVIDGRVKPRAEAKAEFQKAVSEYRVAALLEEHTPEVFEVQLGNIPPHTRVTAQIAYVNELKADVGGEGLLVTIPTSIAPRYGAQPCGYSGSSVNTRGTGLMITVDISASERIGRVESRTHSVSLEMGFRDSSLRTTDFGDLASAPAPDEGHVDLTRARVTLSDRTATLERDFVLLIQGAGSGLLNSQALLEGPSDAFDDSAMMVSITPHDLFSSHVSTADFNGEVIFIADRSGSMGGSKMRCLHGIMETFLKGLPELCSFNIYSFGSTVSSLWPRSSVNSQSALDTAMSHIRSSFHANMGGTEILGALRRAVEKRVAAGASTTQIILITDGEAWDSEKILQFVKETHTEARGAVRFFALGLGEAVSHQLIEGIGRDGGGFGEVIAADGRRTWDKRIIRMLQGALLPLTWNCEVKLPRSVQKEPPTIIQAPYQMPPLHAFSRRSVFFLLPRAIQDDLSHVRVRATLPSGQLAMEKIPIVKTVVNTASIHYLAAKRAMLDLECGGSWLHARGVDADTVRREAERLADRYQVTGKWSAFVAVDRDTDTERPTALCQATRTELAALTKPRNRTADYDITPGWPCELRAPERLSPRPRELLGSKCILSLSPSRGAVVQQGYACLNIVDSSDDRSGSLRCSSPPSAPREVARSFRMSITSLAGSRGLGKRPLALLDLLTTQRGGGHFKLSDDIRLGPLKQIKSGVLRALLGEVSTLRPRQSRLSLLLGYPPIFDTFLVVFYIQNQFAQSKDDWFLQVQKAEQWLNTKVQGKEGEVERLFGVIALYWSSEDASQAASDTDDAEDSSGEVLE